MSLTGVEIRNAKPRDKASRLFDGSGLYLEVSRERATTRICQAQRHSDSVQLRGISAGAPPNDASLV